MGLNRSCKPLPTKNYTTFLHDLILSPKRWLESPVEYAGRALSLATFALHVESEVALDLP
jgi:hypothetical protein